MRLFGIPTHTVPWAGQTIVARVRTFVHFCAAPSPPRFFVSRALASLVLRRREPLVLAPVPRARSADLGKRPAAKQPPLEPKCQEDPPSLLL